MLEGGPTPIYIAETYSGSIKRVCRSTFSAEANGFLAGTEASEYLRVLLIELIHPNVSIRDIDNHYLKKKLLCFTDAKSLEQTLNKDTGAPQDKRVRILIAQVRDSPAFATWADTSQMLADVLMKVGCDRDPLLRAVESGPWQLDPSLEAQTRKLMVQAGRHARKARSRGWVLNWPLRSRHVAWSESQCEATVVATAREGAL